MSKKTSKSAPIGRLNGHSKLEPRRLLNADFSFLGPSAVLTLDNFSDATPNTSETIGISQSGTDFEFSISNGVFNGATSGGISLNAAQNVLTVDSNLVSLSEIFIENDNSVDFGIDFDSFNFAGDLTIANSASGSLFTDVTQQAGSQILLSGTLDISGAESVMLGNALNDFDVVTIDNAEDVILHDNNNIQLDDINLSAASLSGDLDISTSNGGDITQLAGSTIVVSGMANFDADSSGVVYLQGNNDFQDLVSATGSTVEIIDINDLDVGSITAVDDIRLESGSADATPGDGTGGTLTLAGNVTSGNQVLLQASEGVMQSSGIITTDQLLLGGDTAQESSGDFILNQANQVNELAANLLDSLELTNAQNMTIVKATYTSVCDASIMETFSGLDIGDDLTLDVGGLLQQTSGSIVVGDVTTLTATGNIWLVGADCDGDGVVDTANDFQSLVIVSAASAEVVDGNDLTIASATATNQLWLAAGNADATPGDGTGGTLTLAGNVTSGNQVLLQASEGVMQSSGIITTDQLLLGGDTAQESSGDFVLNQANQVNGIASNLLGNLELTSLGDLSIIKAVFESVCDINADEAFVGVVVAGNMRLNVTGSVLQNVPGGLLPAGAVIVGGDTDISATDDICLLGVDCDGDGFQDNSFGGELNLSAGGEIAFATSGNLVIDSGLVSGGGSLRFIADDITISTNIIADQLLLQANNGVSLDDSFFVDVTDLLLTGSGNFEFVTNASNVIDNLAVDIDGNLDLTNSVDLNIGNLTFASNCGDVSIKGVAVTGDFSVVTSFNSGIQQAADSNIIVGGQTSLDASGGNICLIGGDCDGDGSTDNDFNTFQIVSAANAEIRDANDLTVISATVANQLWLAAGDADTTPGDGAGGTLTLDGNITSGSQILLQASEGATQSSGIITTCLLYTSPSPRDATLSRMPSSA